MTIAADHFSHSNAQVGKSTYSWSHTCAATRRLLLVGVPIINPSGVTVSSVTYGGRSLKLLGADETGGIRGELWQLIDPPTGSNSIVVTFSGSCDSWSVANSLSGYGRFFEAASTNTGVNLGSSVSYNVTPITNNATVFDFIVVENGAGLDAGASQTSLADFASGLLSMSFGMSIQGPVSPPGVTAMEWDNLSAGSYVIVSCALAPSEAIHSRLGQISVGLTPYGEFAAKTAASAPQATYSRLGQFGVGLTPHAAFAAKTPAAAGGAATAPLYPIAVTICNRGMMRG